MRYRPRIGAKPPECPSARSRRAAPPCRCRSGMRRGHASVAATREGRAGGLGNYADCLGNRGPSGRAGDHHIGCGKPLLERRGYQRGDVALVHDVVERRFGIEDIPVARLPSICADIRKANCALSRGQSPRAIGSRVRAGCPPTSANSFSPNSFVVPYASTLTHGSASASTGARIAPNAEIEEKNTKADAFAARAWRTSARVATTLSVSIWSTLMSVHADVAAAWTITSVWGRSAPRARSAMTVWKRRAAAAESGGSIGEVRVTAITSKPASARRRATWPPRKPPAPVTSTRTGGQLTAARIFGTEMPCAASRSSWLP